MRIPVSLLLALAAAHVLAGCSTIPVVNEFNAAAADLLLPPAEEKQLGLKVAAEVEGKSKLSTDPELVRFVSQVGQRVARTSPNPHRWAFTFKVVDEPKTVNAFAIPGGNIYVYSGLLKAAKDEAQLASVLAHEVAHVTSRHIAKRMVAAYGMETLSNVALGKDANTLAQIGAAIATQGLLLKNSRDDEAEADSKGVVATARAGYDPRAMVEFFQILRKGEGNVPEFMAFLSDHPLTADRIRALLSDIQAKKLTGASRNETAYQAIQRRIP